MDPGIETSTFAGPGGQPDLDTSGAALSDEDALLEDMLRAVTEQPGVLYWAADQTLNLADYLEKGMSGADLLALQARIESLFSDDPRYEVVRAVVTQVQGQLAVRISARSATGVVAELQLQQDGQTLRQVQVA